MSFVDCPGHETLMRTMLNGASVMDTAILVVAADQKVPQPQTAEHLVVAEIMGLQHILAVQNKVDLVSLPAALRSKEDISFLFVRFKIFIILNYFIF
jgi:translation initiation factor 2 subunit 3